MVVSVFLSVSVCVFVFLRPFSLVLVSLHVLLFVGMCFSSGIFFSVCVYFSSSLFLCSCTGVCVYVYPYIFVCVWV